MFDYMELKRKDINKITNLASGVYPDPYDLFNFGLPNPFNETDPETDPGSL